MREKMQSATFNENHGGLICQDFSPGANINFKTLISGLNSQGIGSQLLTSQKAFILRKYDNDLLYPFNQRLMEKYF